MNENLRYVNYWLPMLAALWAFTSCGLEVVDKDLKEENPRLVIDARVLDKEGKVLVLLSTTTHISFSGKQKPVESADVTLLHNTEEMTLSDQRDGIYMFTDLQVKEGDLFKLRIRYEGDEYFAETVMTSTPVYDAYEIIHHKESNFLEEGYYIYFYNLDQHEEEVFYRFRYILQNQSQNLPGIDSFVLMKDGTMDFSTFFIPYAFKKGDEVRVEISKLQKEVFFFYYNLNKHLFNDGGIFGPTPVNPPGNFTNGALGIFQASSVLQLEIEIE